MRNYFSLQKSGHRKQLFGGFSESFKMRKFRFRYRDVMFESPINFFSPLATCPPRCFSWPGTLVALMETNPGECDDAALNVTATQTACPCGVKDQNV